MQSLHPSSSNAVRRRVILLSVVGAMLLGIYFLLPRTQDKLARPALERNAQNTMRENDVSMLAGAFVSYSNEHYGSLPQTIQGDGAKTLTLCESDCTSGNNPTVTLNYYQATSSAIQYSDYASDVSAPDVHTMRVVKGAACNSDKTGIGARSTAYVAIAFLFKIQAGSNEQQKCVSL